MHYIFPSDSAAVHNWDMICKMIQENYETAANVNNLCVVGATRKNPLKGIKEAQWVNDLNYDKTIVYQLEPLIDNHYWSVSQLVDNLKDADEVWDYDLHNIEILQKYNIDAKFRPMKYTKSLKLIPNNIEKDIDVFFYGTPTPHRLETLKMFMHFGNPKNDIIPKFIWGYNVEGNLLNEFIGRSKIILNINTWDSPLSRQNQTRIFYLLINEKCVVSEKSIYNYYGDNIHEFQGWEDLVFKVNDLLTTGKWADTSNITFGKN